MSTNEAHAPWLGRQAKALLAVVLTLGGLFLVSRYNYLLFHTLAELFSVVIGCGTFLIAWNSRRFLQNGYLLLLGISCLFVAALDLVHALAYKGMAIFPASDANLPTQLWIAARYLESLSLILAPLLLHRHLKAGRTALTYVLVTALLLLAIFVWKVFPVCYVEGSGLTPFKRVSEYLICLILVGALGLLLRRREAFDRQVRPWLAGSLVLTITSELAFTFYVDVYGIANLLGHYLKIAAFYCIYRAFIETGLTQPYALLLREVEQAKEALARTNTNLEHLVHERTASLRETTEDLNAFVYTVAHDLRAPLRAQHGFAQLLREEYGAVLGAEGKLYVDRIAEAAMRLDALVLDLLNYSTVSRDKPALAKLHLSQVVQQVQERLAPQIAKQGAVIRGEGLQELVLGDADSLQLAVNNLVTNALKFVKPGQAPTLRLWTERRDGWVRLWVEDNGIGIAPEYLGKLFGVFQRLHPREKYPGTGIGLALVKKSVERMGGRVGVESVAGQGSRFWLELQPAPTPKQLPKPLPDVTTSSK